jgi:hypothetical protein
LLSFFRLILWITKTKTRGLSLGICRWRLSPSAFFARNLLGFLQVRVCLPASVALNAHFRPVLRPNPSNSSNSTNYALRAARFVFGCLSSLIPLNFSGSCLPLDRIASLFVRSNLYFTDQLGCRHLATVCLS